MRSRILEQSGSVASCFSWPDISSKAATRNKRRSGVRAAAIKFLIQIREIRHAYLQKDHNHKSRKKNNLLADNNPSDTLSISDPESSDIFS